MAPERKSSRSTVTLVSDDDTSPQDGRRSGTAMRKLRRTSMLMLQNVGQALGVSATGVSHKKKKSLAHWENFSTVAFTTAKQQEREASEGDGVCESTMFLMLSWGLPALIGVLTATAGAFVEHEVELLASFRFGYCSSNPFLTEEKCKADFVHWSMFKWYPGYASYVLISTVMAALSAFLTWMFAPTARGSGIPEIKTILGGMKMKDVLGVPTLVIKIVGLGLSVAAGLSCGKEGPLVHIACCWANLIANLTPRYSVNEAKRRELLSTAAAAGVSVAFGAPLGGVLFAYEEVSTIFPSRTMVRAFFAASVAAVTLEWWDATGTGKLTMFGTSYNQPPHFIEYVFFVLLGAVGGLFGAFFVHWNIQVSKGRADGTLFRKKCHIVLEVTLIALFTALTSYAYIYTRVLSSVTIRALFHSCGNCHSADNCDAHTFMLDLCDGETTKKTADLLWTLLISMVLRYVQMIFTFGTGAPAGLFVPSLYTGAALGRVLGIVASLLNEKFHFANSISEPGIYSMIGAAAVLGGVCRVTISLVVIMFELTGGLQLIVPFMVAVLVSKWVGDYFTPGIYDYCIQIRKYPYLHEPDDISMKSQVQDVMDSNVISVHVTMGTIAQVTEFLKSSKYGGYPLITSQAEPVVHGYVHTEALRALLEAAEADKSQDTLVCFKELIANPPNICIDASKLIDKTVLRVSLEMPADQIAMIFRTMAPKVIIAVRSGGTLAGVITKKSFITHMDELHHQHEGKHAGGHHDPEQPTGLQERLL